MTMPKSDMDKGIVYSSRVLVGNWYEAARLEEHKIHKFLEQMKNGELLLARYRTMTKNLNEPTILTQSTGRICFGDRISLLAPHVPATDPPREDKKGLLLGGRISANEIEYHTDLVDGSSLVGLVQTEPAKRNTFVVTSADYCNREGETLKYNQEFLLTLASSLDRKPLYVRYDPNPIPGLCGLYPLYLSENPVSNTRWRFLPVQRPNITRFEQEGLPVQVNIDIVVNHCATNVNLGINIDIQWVFPIGAICLPIISSNGKNPIEPINRCAEMPNGKARSNCFQICTPLMKTCLDIYGRELPNNIWQIYIPIAT